MARTVAVTLGGKERRLKYDLNAIAELGDRLGIEFNLNTIGQDLLATKLKPSALRTLVWAGLIHESPDLTEQEVGGWIDADNFAEVLDAFLGLFGDTFSGKVRTLMQASEPEAAEQPAPSESAPSASETPAA